MTLPARLPNPDSLLSAGLATTVRRIFRESRSELAPSAGSLQRRRRASQGMVAGFGHLARGVYCAATRWPVPPPPAGPPAREAVPILQSLGSPSVTSRKSFGSDNHAPAHEAVLRAISQANQGDAHAYGDDPWTGRVSRELCDLSGARAAYFVFNGTAANVLGLSLMLRPYEAVICAETAHLNVDECGAPERLLGSKLLTAPSPGRSVLPRSRNWAPATRCRNCGPSGNSAAARISACISTEPGWRTPWRTSAAPWPTLRLRRT